MSMPNLTRKALLSTQEHSINKDTRSQAYPQTQINEIPRARIRPQVMNALRTGVRLILNIDRHAESRLPVRLQRHVLPTKRGSILKLTILAVH